MISFPEQLKDGPVFDPILGQALSDDIGYAISELWTLDAIDVLPSSTAGKAMRNPPNLLLYEESTEATRSRSVAEWGHLAASSRDSSSSSSRSLTRSDFLLVRAAEAIGLPLEEALPERVVQGVDTNAPSSRTPLAWKSARPGSAPGHPVATLYNGNWLDRPFRPLRLPRNDKWFGTTSRTDDGAADLGPTEVSSLASELQQERQDYTDYIQEAFSSRLRDSRAPPN